MNLHDLAYYSSVPLHQCQLLIGASIQPICYPIAVATVTAFTYQRTVVSDVFSVTVCSIVRVVMMMMMVGQIERDGRLEKCRRYRWTHRSHPVYGSEQGQ
jgi:hypothetical protein